MFKHICNEWSVYSKLDLETEKFEKYCRSAVNDYIAVGYGFYDALQEYNRCGVWIDSKSNTYTTRQAIEDKFIKFKGYFLQDPEYNKGFVYPVVKKALKEYFLYGVDITEFIRNYINTSRTAIYDYCFSQKVAGKYTTKKIIILIMVFILMKPIRFFMVMVKQVKVNVVVLTIIVITCLVGKI